jgi:hypothetical protein
MEGVLNWLDVQILPAVSKPIPALAAKSTGLKPGHYKNKG